MAGTVGVTAFAAPFGTTQAEPNAHMAPQPLDQTKVYWHLVGLYFGCCLANIHEQIELISVR
jgi:hypothetical protein